MNRDKTDNLRKEVLNLPRPYLEEIVAAAIYKLNNDPNKAVNLELTVITIGS